MTRRMRAAGVALAVVLALAVALVAGACAPVDEPELPVAEPIVYVAVGASDSVGVGADDPKTEAWPVVFHRVALPPGSTITNLAVSGTTTDQALRDQVPKAVALAPDVVTVWLNVNDLRTLVPVQRYEEQLTTLVRALRRGGSTEVLVANTPDLDSLPAAGAFGALRDVLEAQVDIYNDAIADVAEREGATLVDLNGPSEKAENDGALSSLVASDGFHPSTKGHARIADTFAEAYLDED